MKTNHQPEVTLGLAVRVFRTNMLGFAACVAGTGVVILTVSRADSACVSVLHNFAGGPGDGAVPYEALTLDGPTLYGTTTEGGAHGKGVVFKMNVDGSGYTNLHEFAGLDGANPYNSPTLDGSTLYGTTAWGGANGKGTVFKINTDGSEFALPHEFSGNDGRSVTTSLALDGSTLYGAAHFGGSADRGTVFKLNTDGSGFTILHDFSNYDDGLYPTYGRLGDRSG